MTSLIDSIRFIKGIAPVADAFSGTVRAAVNISGIGTLTFFIVKGVGTTGTSTITVTAGDTAVPGTETAVPFHYRRIPTDNLSPGAVTAATAAGFATTAGSGDSYLISVDAAALAASGYKYCHLKAVELVDSPVLGTVIAIGSDLRYADDTSDVVS